MSARLKTPLARVCLILAAVCLAVAAVLGFALAGYSTLALLLACAGVALALFAALPRKGRAALTALVCLALLVFAAALAPVVTASGGDGAVAADYLIVLGAGVRGDVPSLSLLDRLRAAKDYLDGHPACTAVLSGGRGDGENLSEAEAMYRWLTEHGVPPDRLLREDRAASTRENLEYSFALIPDPERYTVAVLSSEYHLYRAKRLAEAQGHTVFTIPAPTSLPMLKCNYYCREALGVVYYTVFGS